MPCSGIDRPSSQSAQSGLWREPAQMGVLRNPPATRLSTNRTRNTKNRILAMPAAPAAMPPKPNRAAINATTRNISAQYNMVLSSNRDEHPRPELALSDLTTREINPFNRNHRAERRG